MRTTSRLTVLAAVTVTMAANGSAGEIFSQSELSTLLGGNLTMEDFEGNGLLGSGQISGSFLNSTAIFGGYGPGLVQAGVDYSSQALFWNDNGYFGLNTRTLGDASGWRNYETTITYTAPVTAFGFDMQGYSGFTMTGSVTVYDTSNNVLTVNSVNGGFFGWENLGGIGRVVVSADNDGYIMIDNHGYGAVPEPASLAVLSLGALAALRRRRNA